VLGLRATFGEEPTAAHIHAAEKASKGQIVADLAPTFAMGEAADAASACRPVGKPLVDQIEAQPDRFHVNVHSKAHPDGAVRGQLRKGPA
jgi:hypothetical protein